MVNFLSWKERMIEMSGFRDLKVWVRSKKLAVNIYKITQEGKFKHDFSFNNQIRRAAVSVASNIAEGDERGSNREAVRFFYIAKGSLAEVSTQIEIAYEIDYLSDKVAGDMLEECQEIGKMLGALIKVRS